MKQCDNRAHQAGKKDFAHAAKQRAKRSGGLTSFDEHLALQAAGLHYSLRLWVSSTNFQQIQALYPSEGRGADLATWWTLVL